MFLIFLSWFQMPSVINFFPISFQILNFSFISNCAYRMASFVNIGVVAASITISLWEMSFYQDHYLPAKRTSQGTGKIMSFFADCGYSRCDYNKKKQSKGLKSQCCWPNPHLSGGMLIGTPLVVINIHKANELPLPAKFKKPKAHPV